MRKTLLWLLLLFPCAVSAQDYRYDNIVLGPRGPVPSANVAVCTQPATTSTQPCSPLASLFTGATGSTSAPNPLTTDSLGSYDFYAAPGVYTIPIYGPQVTTPVVMTDMAVGAYGNGNAYSFNSALYVGGPLGSSWALPTSWPDQCGQGCCARRRSDDLYSSADRRWLLPHQRFNHGIVYDSRPILSNHRPGTGRNYQRTSLASCRWELYPGHQDHSAQFIHDRLDSRSRRWIHARCGHPESCPDQQFNKWRHDAMHHEWWLRKLRERDRD